MKNSVFCLLFVMCSTLTGCQSLQKKQALSDHGYRWYATSAEYQALCHQSFNIARMQLSDVHTHPVKHAVVIDLDETVLSNAQFVEKYIVNRKKLGFDWHQELVTGLIKKKRL